MKPVASVYNIPFSHSFKIHFSRFRNTKSYTSRCYYRPSVRRFFRNNIEYNLNFFVVRIWDGTIRFMPRVKLSIIKQDNLTSNKADNDEPVISRTVSVDGEDESMDNDDE
jgi:hypothetical protein